jgi:uncharacterized membrane protein YphA (DoxX/SURF4 family)
MARLTDRVEIAAQKAAVPSMRYSIALIMIWFGLPKLFSGTSSAEDLAVSTVEKLTLGIVAGDTARIILAAMEVGFGIVLIIGRWMPLMLLLILGHMIGTFTPFLFFPELLWASPAVLTIEGQYIVKNVVIIAGLIFLAGWGMRKGGRNRPANYPPAASA